MWLSQLSGEQQQTMLRLAHNVIVSDGLLAVSYTHLTLPTIYSV